MKANIIDNLWILAADANRGRIFKTDSLSGTLEEHLDFVHTQARLPESDLAKHSRGTYSTNQGAESHGLNQQGSLKEHHAKVFAKQIAHQLADAEQQHRFKNLILIASPGFLGLLRKELCKKVIDRVCFELNKDLTTLSPSELRQHLPRYLSLA